MCRSRTRFPTTSWRPRRPGSPRRSQASRFRRRRSPPPSSVPNAPASRLVRLRQRLAGSGTLGRGLLGLLSRDQLDEDTWEAIEDLLLGADIGVQPTQELVERLRTRLRVEGGAIADARTVLREELITLVDPTMDRALRVSGADGNPGVVLVVGVNGTGKTTTVGKLARILVAEDRTVLLAAADTFRAAAADQLSTWGERVGVEVVRGPEAGDPASVAFEAVKAGAERGSTRSSSTRRVGCRTSRA